MIECRFFAYFCSVIANYMMVESINTKKRGCLYIGPGIKVVSINVHRVLCGSPYENEPMSEKDISDAFEQE